MIDHITIRVSHLKRSKAFYDRTLAPLGMNVVLGDEKSGFFGYGTHGPELEIAKQTKKDPAHARIHIAFKVKSKKIVDQFYQEALTAGGTDNGKPGPRPDYTPTYYAAFVRDPDGNNIEVCYYQK